MLTNSDIAELTTLRRTLHKRPELSGQEGETAARIVAELAPLSPTDLVTGLGGHGVAVVFNGAGPGPTVMIRCELDGLPIEELSDAPHRSQVPGKGHLCGHDGHMSIVMAVARVLARQPIARGRVVLLFQPAEETGAGAGAVIADPAFADLAPDYAFSLHNLPGLPLGEIQIRDGAMNCASRGMRVGLIGRTSHASAPQDGVSPMAALSVLMPALTQLSQGEVDGADFARATLTHTRMGEPTFGVSPGEAELWVTLRTVTDDAMAGLVARAERLVAEEARRAGLQFEITYDDVFHACTNDAEAAGVLRGAVQKAGFTARAQPNPMFWSEDFGRFGQAGAKSAMFVLGSGEDQPQLHNPDYDFPDDLIPIGAGVFVQAIRALCGSA